MVAPARPLPAAAVRISDLGFYFVTSAAKVLGSMVSSRDQKPFHLL